MSNILFIVSIILAIPTFGLSLLVYFIVEGWLLTKDSNALEKQIVEAFILGKVIETTTRTNGSIKHFFSKYKAGEVDDERYPGAGVRSFSGHLIMPWHKLPIFVHVIREGNGFTTVSAKSKIDPGKPPPGASAQERVDHLMNYMSDIRKG